MVKYRKLNNMYYCYEPHHAVHLQNYVLCKHDRNLRVNTCKCS